jgi:ubiquitin C-terminal hydrolase
MGECPKCTVKQILHFPSECRCLLYCSKKCSYDDFYIHIQSCEKEKLTIERSESSRFGLVGLTNLGNTCYMNTAIQCISNCWELTNYFLRNYYQSHINTVNPIGTKGILAKKYANLIKHLWYGMEVVYSPFDLKNAIGHFNSNVYMISLTI